MITKQNLVTKGNSGEQETRKKSHKKHIFKNQKGQLEDSNFIEKRKTRCIKNGTTKVSFIRTKK